MSQGGHFGRPIRIYCSGATLGSPASSSSELDSIDEHYYILPFILYHSPIPLGFVSAPPDRRTSLEGCSVL